MLPQKMTVTEILHGACPVDAGHQSIKPETGSPYDFRGIDIESIFNRGSRLDFINVMQQKNARGHADDETNRGQECSFSPAAHFPDPKVVPRLVISDSCVRKPAPRRSVPLPCRKRHTECFEGSTVH